MNYTNGPLAWRLPIACQMIFAFVSLELVQTLDDIADSGRLLFFSYSAFLSPLAIWLRTAEIKSRSTSYAESMIANQMTLKL